MEDFAGPTFSLGLDLDFDFDQSAPPPPNHEREESRCSKQSPEEVTTTAVEDLVSSQSIDEDYGNQDFQPQTLISPDLPKADEDSPTILKRLKRGLRKNQRDSSIKEVTTADEEEIEVISSPEHNRKGKHSALQNGSSWKFPLSEEFTSKLKGKQSTEIRNESTFRSIRKLKTSPLRRIQLLDSDSDDSCSSEDAERQRKLQTEDLWKDFGPEKSANIPTPALDEFCEEYFGDKKVDESKEVCDNRSGIGEMVPAYKYFQHDDPRIQRLVRQRLPNFSPLGVKNTEIPQSQPQDADIDYKCQFSQKESTSGINGSSRMGSTSNWVTPKKCINGRTSQGCVSQGPKNAGKRRVRAEEGSCSSGTWFTGQGGRKVYVSKNGQEFTGRMAYRRYKKESGTGFKKSRNKTASKNKSKR